MRADSDRFGGSNARRTDQICTCTFYIYVRVCTITACVGNTGSVAGVYIDAYNKEKKMYDRREIPFLTHVISHSIPLTHSLSLSEIIDRWKSIAVVAADEAAATLLHARPSPPGRSGIFRFYFFGFFWEEKNLLPLSLSCSLFYPRVFMHGGDGIGQV